MWHFNNPAFTELKFTPQFTHNFYFTFLVLNFTPLVQTNICDVYKLAMVYYNFHTLSIATRPVPFGRFKITC